MANLSEDPVMPTAQSVANAFIQQYYVILHKSPDMVYKFYCEPSVLGRFGSDGAMTMVTSLQDINDKIMSFDYQNYHTEILTVDAQGSYKGGVFVLVTGCMTGSNFVSKSFSQSFFLAPQEKGYFVLNDILRYIDNDADNRSSPKPPSSPTIELSTVAAQPVPSQIRSVEVDNGNGNVVPQLEVVVPEENGNVVPQLEVVVPEENGNVVPQLEVVVPKENGNVVPQLEVVVPEENGHAGENGHAVENGLAEENSHAEENGLVENPVASSQNAPPSATKETPSDLHKDVPKKSFASVVNALNKNNAPFQARALRAPAPKPKSVEQPKAPSVPAVHEAPAVPEAPAPTSNRVPEKNEHRAKAYAIFVGNLPMNATCEDLEKLFKQFGPIKNDDGIQVRSSRGTCFGFVEFESATSMQSALEASPVMFGNRRLSIEVRQGNNKISSGKNGYRNDSFKGRGNYNGGNRGYGRNEFEKRGEFFNRAKGNKGYSNRGEKTVQQEAM